MYRNKHDCPWCGKTDTARVLDVDDSSLTILCVDCEEEGCVEPDGIDMGGLEWVEAMAAKKAGEL